MDVDGTSPPPAGPEAWVTLPPERDLRGFLSSWGPREAGLGPRLAQARATLRNAAGFTPAVVGLARATARSVGRRMAYDFGFIPAMGRLIMAHREVGLPFLMLFSRVMFGPGALTRAEREAVAAVAAAAQDCFY